MDGQSTTREKKTPNRTMIGYYEPGKQPGLQVPRF
jgi:hypothetical protein